MRRYEKENFQIVRVAVDLKSLLSFTAYCYCCVELFVASYSAVPCKENGMPTGREAFLYLSRVGLNRPNRLARSSSLNLYLK